MTLFDQEDYILKQESDFADEGPQPVEVVLPSEYASTAENQAPVDPQKGKFIWKISNFSHLNVEKRYSNIFIVGGYKWRVMVNSEGTDVGDLSMYLLVADSETLPYGWTRFAEFTLGVIDTTFNKHSISIPFRHKFYARKCIWGSKSFVPLSTLRDASNGYMCNDTCILEVVVDVRRVSFRYDSKAATSFVGLRNTGSTCYLNSLLQTLYHIPSFRKAVYHMPTTEDELPSESFPVALQSLFCELHYSDSSVATNDLTKSFGRGDTHDSSMQPDVHGFNRVLYEKLDEKMKGTVVEGTIPKLFEGHMTYIESNNVGCDSIKIEPFYDLQLDVKGCSDVYASLDKYVGDGLLEGDYKYDAKQHGLQDAKKRVSFIDFPPVLQLLLKRFEYDSSQHTMVKINDTYEFPLELDLDRGNGKYLSAEADKKGRNFYTLHSVLAHSGGVDGGHYCACIKPTLSDTWFMFDDEMVTEVTKTRTQKMQYGDKEMVMESNAYMIVYIRQNNMEDIMCNVDEKDITEHFRMRLKRKREEKEFTVVKVSRKEDLAEHIDRKMFFDLVDHTKINGYRIQRQTPFNEFKDRLFQEFRVPVEFQRFFYWHKRRSSHTYRPFRALSDEDEKLSIGELTGLEGYENGELHLFMEDLQHLPCLTNDHILLFFKIYDPEKEELRYGGSLFVRVGERPLDILDQLNEMARFPTNEKIEIYEELQFEPELLLDHVDKEQTFGKSKIEDGDIFWVQKSYPVENSSLKYPDVRSFLEHVRQSNQEKCT